MKDVFSFSESPIFRRGDANGDGQVNVGDVSFLLSHLFVMGSPEPPCPDSADVNDDGALIIDDAVRLLGYLFLGGAPPPPPGPLACGIDPTRDELEGCAGGTGLCP